MAIGIVANNGILRHDADQKMHALGLSAEDSMRQAGRRGLRPIVMTALAIVTGMLRWHSPLVRAPRCCNLLPSRSSAAF